MTGVMRAWQSREGSTTGCLQASNRWPTAQIGLVVEWPATEDYCL